MTDTWVILYWGMQFRDAGASAMQALDEFHHFLVLVLLLIMSFVGLIMVNMSSKLFIAKTLTSDHKLESSWTMWPVVVLLAVGVPSLFLLYSFDSHTTHADLTYKVTGHQWYWTYSCSFSENLGFTEEDSFMVPTAGGKMDLFRLLDTSYVVLMPLKTAIRVVVTSDDVLHSWSLNAFGVKIDACPGRLNEVGMYLTQVGTYFGQCSEICGSNHSYMPIQVSVFPIL